MLTGLHHLHRTLAYLVFAFAFVNTLLVLARGRTNEKTAGYILAVTRYGIRMVGGLTVLLGLLLWAAHTAYPLGTVWLWASLGLWVPVEMLGSRLVVPEASLVRDGGQGTSRMVVGAVGQLLLIAIIFGLMSVRP